MRLGVVAVVCVLASCEAAEGIEIVVATADVPGVAEVRLYVGTNAASPARLAPATFTPADDLRGQAWTLDDPSFAHVRTVAAGDPATFSFMSAPDVTTITAIAVGFDASGPIATAAMFEVPFPAGRVARWQLALEPAKPATSQATTREVQVWGPNPGDRTCVQAVLRDDRLGSGLRRAFIVDADDQDCDSYKPGKLGECDDTWHGATTGPSLDRLSCLESVDLMSMTNAIDGCVFGGPRCTDGDPDPGAAGCSHETLYCAPRALCTVCASPDDPVGNFACALKLSTYTNMAAPVMYARCPLRYEPTGRLCTQRLTIVPASGAAPAVACPSAVMFHGSAPGDTWTATPTIGGIQFQFGVRTDMGGCHVELQAQGNPAIVAANAFPFVGLVAAQLVTGRGAVVPMKFDAEPVAACDVVTVDAACNVLAYDTNETAEECAADPWQPLP